MLQESLDVNPTPYSLTDEQVAFYQKNRYIKLKEVLSAAELKFFGDQITKKVIELNTMHIPMEERDTYCKAFLQIVNLWTQDETVRELVFSKRLAKIAADLMQVNGVRLYHDQALYKEPAGGYTPWHADQFYWPLATDKTITAWIPLQSTPLEMGPLEFSAASQSLTDGHDLKISDDSEQEIDSLLTDRDFEHVVEPFDLGEVSFHSGWLYHRAGPNSTADPRRVMCVIYMDEDMTLKEPDNDDQQRDWDAWCPGAQPGKKIQTPLNPVLWSS
jgi:ectoine hydroxylase-related dioxygenase (phytanoyl-CoA dioxygenase family)